MEPDPERAIYEFNTTDEFDKMIGDSKWLKEFSNRICWAFMDTMSRYENGSKIYGKKEIPAVYIDAVKGDGTVHCYFADREYVDDLTYNLKGERKKDFEKAQKKLLRKATAAIKEYIETVEEI